MSQGKCLFPMAKSFLKCISFQGFSRILWPKGCHPFLAIASVLFLWGIPADVWFEIQLRCESGRKRRFNLIHLKTPQDHFPLCVKGDIREAVRAISEIQDWGREESPGKEKGVHWLAGAAGGVSVGQAEANEEVSEEEAESLETRSGEETGWKCGVQVGSWGIH